MSCPRPVFAGAALAALLAAGCGGGSAAPAPGGGDSQLPVVAPGKWVVIGSSSAAGAGASAGQAWVSRLQSDPPRSSVAVVNLAQGGTTTYAGLSASAPAVPSRPAPDPSGNVDAALAQSPRLLLVSYPTNDTALGYGIDETVGNLHAIRAAAQARGVAVIVLSTQPRALPDAQRALLPQIDARLDAALSPCFVPVREALAGSDGRLDPRYDAGDGVHPNDAGHALILERVRAVLDAGRCVRLPAP